MGLVLQDSLVFSSVGDPSMFTDQWEAVFAVLRPFLGITCEITIEANPEDITRESLSFWQALGINRISLGVQSFDVKGLSFLH